jgi:hypothetical protein
MSRRAGGPPILVLHGYRDGLALRLLTRRADHHRPKTVFTVRDDRTLPTQYPSVTGLTGFEDSIDIVSDQLKLNPSWIWDVPDARNEERLARND